LRSLPPLSLIVRLPLVAALALGGCDKAKPDAGQANAAASAPVAAPSPEGSETSRDHKGLALPAMPFDAPGGGPATFGKWRGKPVLVNLWATWCAPCVKELPTLDALAAKGGVSVVAISEDNGGDAQVGPFWKAKGLKALTPYTDQHMRLMTALQIDTLPTTILFDGRGKEVWRVTGGMDWTGDKAAKLLAEAK
jgi:thiol-disulfide isomerase/thioredoxin